jgi:hypothetical protein
VGLDIYARPAGHANTKTGDPSNPEEFSGSFSNKAIPFRREIPMMTAHE